MRTACESLVTSPLPVMNTTSANTNTDALAAANENMAKVVGLEEVVSVVNEGVVHACAPGQRSGVELASQAGMSDDLRSAVNVIFNQISAPADKPGGQMAVVDQHSASMVPGIGLIGDVSSQTFITGIYEGSPATAVLQAHLV